MVYILQIKSNKEIIPKVINLIKKMNLVDRVILYSKNRECNELILKNKVKLLKYTNLF